MKLVMKMWNVWNLSWESIPFHFSDILNFENGETMGDIYEICQDLVGILIIFMIFLPGIAYNIDNSCEKIYFMGITTKDLGNNTYELKYTNTYKARVYLEKLNESHNVSILGYKNEGRTSKIIVFHIED